jgi:hypothetical protein
MRWNNRRACVELEGGAQTVLNRVQVAGSKVKHKQVSKQQYQTLRRKCDVSKR